VGIEPPREAIERPAVAALGIEAEDLDPAVGELPV
jgi:hypothetical protein